ncbi:MAG: exodeoxyribonuclease VII small subunit [Saccharofermentanales bacterium]|jgi:exodeoxyribonuclease VII small subunit
MKDVTNPIELPEDLTYEQAIERLEAIVTRLEQGNADLAASMALFQEGVALSEFCTKQLTEMREAIDQLVSPSGDTEPLGEMDP